MNYNKLKLAIYNSCSKETCYYSVKDNWNKDNPLFGHCTIASLIVNDYFGGKIMKASLKGYSYTHYYNEIEGKIVDSTIEQFKIEPIFEDVKEKDRIEILINEDTKSRYETLKNKVELYLEKLDKINTLALNCRKCEDLVENFETSETIHYGTKSDIVLIGEAPANNGWRKSGRCWYSIDGKITASGKVMNKLLEPYNLIVDDITFLEAVKCFPKERKNLKKCSNNCKYILDQQIELINPKVVICLGDYATKCILSNVKYKNFNEVIGKEFIMNNVKIIPIYHPSPISPKSYIDNILIFKMIFNNI